MEFLIKLFARCLAVAVVATPMCLLGEVVQKTEQLPNVKFNFEKPAAEFKKAVDAKVEQKHNKTGKGFWRKAFMVVATVVLGAAAVGALVCGVGFIYAYMFLLADLGLAITSPYLSWGLVGAFSALTAVAVFGLGWATKTVGACAYRDLTWQETSEPTFVSKS